MTNKKGATSAPLNAELSSVRFIAAIDIASEAHHFFSSSTRVRSKTPQAFLDLSTGIIEIRVDLNGTVHTSYVPMSNVASYSKI